MGDTLVLCYHALSDRWPATLSVSPDDFEAQVGTLLRRGYRPVTFSKAVSAADSAAPGRRVAVTFDDAYRSVLERARPVLERLEAPGTVFVPTDFPGREEPMAWPGIDQWLGGAFEDELHCMAWDELCGLADAGWEVGSHTCSHPRLTELADECLEAELRASHERCAAELGRACESISYPYGDVDGRVTAAARKAGYRYGAALPQLWDSMAAASELEWPRVGIYHGEPGWRWRLKVSRTGRRLRASGAWRLVARRGRASA